MDRPPAAPPVERRTARPSRGTVTGGARRPARPAAPGPTPGSLRAICARTGLSTSTVSLALRGAYGVSEATRRRVLEAASDIGYDLRRLRGGRGTAARAVRRRPGVTHRPATLPLQPAGMALPGGAGPAPVRRQIAIVYPAESGFEAVARAAHYGRYLRGIQAAAARLGADLVFLPATDGDADPLLRFMFGTGPGTADGVILLGMGDEAPVVRRALTRPAPVVLLSRYVPELPCSWISVDHVRAADLMTEHLIERGYRWIALVADNLAKRSWQRQRYQGYAGAMQRHGLVVDPAGGPIEGADDDVVDRLERFIGRHGVEAALFVPNDRVALHVRDRLASRGLEAPRDYGLAGYDNIADDFAGRPVDLTSIGFPREHMGALALRMVLELCNDPSQEQQHIIVAPELHVRASTRGPRAWGNCE